MLLKSVKYKNFRPFNGDHMIMFDRPEEKKESNVIVILGDNTHGKSTIVLSFIWCLYGESKFNRPDEILNKVKERQMEVNDSESACVEVVFNDDGKLYTVKRSQKFIMNKEYKLIPSDSVVKMTYVNEGGETCSCGTGINEITETINAILPKDLAEFFFFEGEKDNEVTKKDLSKAVKTLLGLEAIANLRKHLYGTTKNKPAVTSVMGYYEGKQNDADNVKAKKEHEKKIETEKEIEKNDSRLAELNEQIASYKNDIEEINKVLREAAPTKELQKRRDAIVKEIKFEKEQYDRACKRLVKEFNGNSLSLFVLPILEKAKKRLLDMDVADKGIKGIDKIAIDELLKRKECLCGTELNKGTLAYKNVENYIDFMPPKNVGLLVREMLDSIEESEYKRTTFIENFFEAYKSIQFSIGKMNELEAEDRAKIEKLKVIAYVDIDKKEENLNIYKKRISGLEEEKGTLERKAGTLLSGFETASNNFNMYKSKSEKNKEFQVYFKYAEQLYNSVNEQYLSKEKEIRERLNSHVTTLFNNIYSGKRTVNVDENYKVEVTYNGKPLADTGGLRVIQYFSFVGGLVKLAFEIMQEREKDVSTGEELDKTGEEYPLVLDAAFSHADENHVKAIARELSTATNQLIFAIMKKDWIHAEEGLHGKVGRMYELIKVSEDEVEIKEVR